MMEHTMNCQIKMLVHRNDVGCVSNTVVLVKWSYVEAISWLSLVFYSEFSYYYGCLDAVYDDVFFTNIFQITLYLQFIFYHSRILHTRHTLTLILNKMFLLLLKYWRHSKKARVEFGGPLKRGTPLGMFWHLP